MKRVRVGVLVSGAGSNLQALLDAARAEDYPAEVALVLSNVQVAGALERARAAGVPARFLDPKQAESRAHYDAALAGLLAEHEVEVVCLAGFMRLLGAPLLSAFPGRILNIHPSLLPAFPGLHAVRQALEHGVKLSGCTVHLVDAGLDSGPILVQAAVPVLDGDDEASLAARILAEEHCVYPLALRLFCEGKVHLDGRRAKTRAEPGQAKLALRNPGD